MPSQPPCSCARCGSPLDSAPGAGLAEVCFSCIAASLFVEPLPPLSHEDSGDPTPASDESPPRIIGAYDLLREIARGGMGVVWLVRHRPTGRHLALKMLPSSLSADPVRLTRFHSEATLAARLIHPGIVAIRDIGDHDGVPFFVMDYIEGRDLGAVTRNKPMPHREAARIVLSVAAAIQFAHDQGVLHRDLKPSNVLLDANQQPHVSDFGIAKLVEPASDLTGTGEILGSPSFMAPEQVGGQRGSAGVRTDVYGLGGLLYFCLTGRAPFLADSIPATLQRVLTSSPIPPSQWTDGIPPALERIVLRCLEKDPSRRFSSASSLAAELERALRGEPLLTRETSRAQRLAQHLRSHRGSAGWVACAAGLAVAGALATFHLGYRWGRSPVPDLPTQKALFQYVTEVTLAGRSLVDGDHSAARRHLASSAPTNTTPDLRGFEWHWLFAQTAPRPPSLAFSVAGAPTALHISPDGRSILLADSNALRVIPFAGGQELVRHPLPWTDARRTLVTDASGRFCWMGDNVGVHRLDLASGSLQSLHRGPVADIHRLDSAQTVLARISHSDGSSHDRLFNSATGSPMDSKGGAIPASPPRAWAVTRSSNGLRMAWTDPDGLLRIQNLSTHLIEFSAPVVHAPASRWLLDASGTHLVQFGSPHARPTVRHASAWSEAVPIGNDTLRAVDAGFLPDAQTLVTLSPDGLIRSWPLQQATRSAPWDGPVPEDVTPSIVPSQDGSRLAVGWILGEKATCKIWDCRDPGAAPMNFTGFPIAFSPKADQMLLWHPNGELDRVRLDAASEPVRFRINPSPGSLPDQLSFDSGFFACLGHDGRLRLVHAASGQLLPGPARSVRSWVLSPDGDHFLFTGMTGAFLASLRSPDPVEVSNGDIPSMAFHPHGRMAAIGHVNGRVRLMDVASQTKFTDLAGGSGAITALAFSPDGRSLVSGSDDGSLRFWNCATSQEIFKTHLKTGIRSLVFHPDGQHLMVVRHQAIETLDASNGTYSTVTPGKTNPGGFWGSSPRTLPGTPDDPSRVPPSDSLRRR